MPVRVLGRLAILLFVVTAGTARAEDRDSGLTDAQARALVRDFAKAYRTDVVEARLEALGVLAEHDHPRVADRLLELLKSRKNGPEIQMALFGALSTQHEAKRKVMKKVAAWLEKEAEEAKERIVRAHPDFRLDPKTGEGDFTSEEGRLALQATKTRGLVLREAMLCLRLLAPEAPRGAERLAAFLHDPHDPLVVETLEAFGRWRLGRVLPDLLDLYRMYPGEGSWDTEHVTISQCCTRKAKAVWMTLFGHPDKRRPRPEVVKALRACLEAITGRTFETPEALAAWLQGPEGRRAAA